MKAMKDYHRGVTYGSGVAIETSAIIPYDIIEKEDKKKIEKVRIVLSLVALERITQQPNHENVSTIVAKPKMNWTKQFKLTSKERIPNIIRVSATIW